MARPGIPLTLQLRLKQQKYREACDILERFSFCHLLLEIKLDRRVITKVFKIILKWVRSCRSNIGGKAR